MWKTNCLVMILSVVFFVRVQAREAHFYGAVVIFKKVAYGSASYTLHAVGSTSLAGKPSRRKGRELERDRLTHVEIYKERRVCMQRERGCFINQSSKGRLNIFRKN